MKPIDKQRYYEVVPVKQAVEDDLLALPGVTGVDVGYKQVGGEETNQMAVLVFVKEKGRFAEEERIPASVQGVPTDVIECEFRPLSVDASPATAGTTPAAGVDTNLYNPVVGGCAVTPARDPDSYGTLGVLVRDNGTGAQAYLSCWHVFCVNNSWSDQGVDDRIVQPAIWMGGELPADVIGSVYAGRLGEIVRHFGYNWYVDCALCTVDGRAAASNILSIGTLKGFSEPNLGELVRKYGATTRITFGAVQSTNFTTAVEYPGVGKVVFYYQYRITAPDASMPAFGVAGDSGAIVVDTEMKAVGLVFAGGTTGNVIYTVANPMYMVLGALNISLVTS